MATNDFIRARIDQRIDLRHPLAVLAQRLPRTELEAALAPAFAHKPKQPGAGGVDLFGPVPAGAAYVSNAVRSRLPLRLMISLLYLKHTFGLSRRAVSRQRTVVGRLICKIGHKMRADLDSTQLTELRELLQRAERIRSQRPRNKGKLYALHAPEAGWHSRGKAPRRYEFGVKAGVVVMHKGGLIVEARAFAGNPYDGHTLARQLEQASILMQDLGVSIRQVAVDLGYRGRAVEADNPGIDLIHRGKFRSLSKAQRRVLKRRHAIEPVIVGHLKDDHGMRRCRLKGSAGGAVRCGRQHPLAEAICA